MSQTHRDESDVSNGRAPTLRAEVGSRKHDAAAAAPVLEPALLACVQQLNLDYLELLVAERGAAGCATQLQHLPPRQGAALASLSARALRAVAEATYSLYSLGFENGDFWDSLCSSAPAPMATSVVHRYARVGDSSPQYTFCKLALLHAWHVATTNPMAARVVYAMPLATVQRLASTPLWQVRCIAASHRVLLMPRWPTNPAFWPDLIRFAAANDMRRLHTARLLGYQLVAAELEVSCAMSRRDVRGASAIASPRLRARKLQMTPRSVRTLSALDQEEM